MEDHEYAVRRATDINLHKIDSEGDSFSNRGHGIFRGMPRGPTMADSQHPPHEVSLKPWPKK
jgi:hypothetical protein